MNILNQRNIAILSHFYTTVRIFSLCLFTRIARALSSAGLERLPYKEEVVGSNPTGPTMDSADVDIKEFHVRIINTRFMAVTRLKRKQRRNKTQAAKKKADIKRLVARPKAKSNH